MPKLTYTTPPPSLMIELREVAADARALAAELTKANQLPSDFPVEQLQELLVELQSLPEGTAEGCRQPLEYARSRLPAIRRTFIQTEELSRQPRANGETPPPLTRGMVIDQRIGALVNSVTTALDEYRALASIEFDETADTAPSREIDPTSPLAVEAMAASASAENNLSLGIEQVEKITEATSETAEILKRQMRDARGLLRIARIELRMPGFVPRWYRNTIDTVRDYPKLLQMSAKAIRIGVDIARPLADAWSHFEHNFKHLVLDSIEHAAKGLQAVGKKWEAEREDPKALLIAFDTEHTPLDFNLAAVYEMILAGQAPPPSWRHRIHRLDFARSPLANLAPLANLTALQSLNITSTEVLDLSPIAGLTELQSLALVNTQIFDLAPLAGLIALRSLSFSDTKVIDIGPLGRLTALQTLYLSNTHVSDLTALAGLQALQTLNLRETNVVDLTPLAGLIRLQQLDLSNTKITDLAPLADLIALQSLKLNGTHVSDFAPIAGLPELNSLNLSDTSISDLMPLSTFTALRSINLCFTNVTDLKPLEGLAKLQFVYVESSRKAAALGRTIVRHLVIDVPD